MEKGSLSGFAPRWFRMLHQFTFGKGGYLAVCAGLQRFDLPPQVVDLLLQGYDQLHQFFPAQ